MLSKRKPMALDLPQAAASGDNPCMNALSFHAGPRAMARIAAHGLRAADVAIVPAAAGGPKGLILQSLDQFVFGSWLPSAPRERTLIGASIGAWRMAAACQADPVRGCARLGDLYIEQTYSAKPDMQEIDAVCRQLLADFVGGHEQYITQHPAYRLHLLAVRGLRALQAPAHRRAEIAGFAQAALLNATSRERLAHMLERVVIGDARDPATWLRERFDGFTTRFAPLDQHNLAAALLASGTLPLVMLPVRGIAGAPAGTYWDGGIIDYHLALPYARLGEGELVLYPHFSRHIVPGWLDKTMPWRRAARGARKHWLDNVILVAPTPEFVASLPRAKLPDRKDFAYFGADHAARMRAWRTAVGKGARLRDEFAAFVDKPDLSRVQPL
jgi:hypothetical protein